jgi:hypothetical protein
MLKLSESQWRALQARDLHQFIVSVCDQFMATRADVLDLPDRATALERMQGAHHAAKRIGFTSTAHIVHLMYLAADAPGIHTDPLVEAYLRKPGAAPEQRLDDMLAVMNRKMRETY